MVSGNDLEPSGASGLELHIVRDSLPDYPESTTCCHLECPGSVAAPDFAGPTTATCISVLKSFWFGGIPVPGFRGIKLALAVPVPFLTVPHPGWPCRIYGLVGIKPKFAHLKIYEKQPDEDQKFGVDGLLSRWVVIRTEPGFIYPKNRDPHPIGWQTG